MFEFENICFRSASVFPVTPLQTNAAGIEEHHWSRKMPECRIEALALARQPLNEIEAMLALTSVTSASSSTSSSTSTRGSL